jgi:Pup amidohydrolase
LFKTVARNRGSIWTTSKSRSRASKHSILGRYIGLETEYGLHFSSETDRDVCDAEWYFRLVEKLVDDVPLVRSIDDPLKFFLANGGCISLEPTNDGNWGQGLLESATPECYSPRDVVASQSALDHLLARHLKFLFPHTETCLVKNSSDAEGRCYGQQENYTVEIASGLHLLFWRLGLIVLLPLLLLYKATSVVFLGVLFLLAKTLGRFVTPRQDDVIHDYDSITNPMVRESSKSVARFGFGEHAWLFPKFVQAGSSGLRVLHAPLAFLFLTLIRLTALRPLRRQIMPFLATRVIWDGGGYVDARGRFWLSARMRSLTCEIGFGKYWGERPAIVLGHWLSAMCSDPWYSLRGWAGLFSRRQRIQMQLGDATPCSQVEFLRLGTTSLVLDLIERGFDFRLPRLRRPLDAMTRFASDWLLIGRVPDRKGLSRSAIEIQREYAKAVRGMLGEAEAVPEEAWEILQLWQGTLDQLEESRHDTDCQRWLLGRVDWISKKWLLDQVPATTNWAVKKKIDLRYHEISGDGYQTRLSDALNVVPVVTESQCNRALRLPPVNSRAMRRGYLIREFASNDDVLRVSWDHAELVVGEKKKTIRF